VIAYPQHRNEIEAYLTRKPNPNLSFVWLTPDHPLDPWKPEKGERGIRIHYIFWLAKAYRRAAEICQAEGIDLAHHVSLGTVGAAPPFCDLPVPTVWGPIGGGQTVPGQFLTFFQSQRWAEIIRTARVKTLVFSRRLRRNAAACRMTFATNFETLTLLKRVGATSARVLLDCGLPPGDVPAHLPPSPQLAEFTFLWVGRLEYRKGLALGLESLAKATNVKVRLLVAGGGPQQSELESLTKKLGLSERVRFMGRVPHQQMPEVFASASAFLFTSLRDSFGSVVLEAMAYGLPILALNHQGVALVPDAASIKVPVTNPSQTIAALAASIDLLAASTDMVEKMRSAAWNFAREQTWDRRATYMSEVYEAIVGAHEPTRLGLRELNGSPET
jgi:glycosyltransferase involved in cell wall biosynthesis